MFPTTSPRRAHAALLATVAFAAFAAAVVATSVCAQQENAEEKSPREVMVGQAQRLRPIVRSEIGNNFLNAVPELPAIPEARVVYRNKETRDAVTGERAASMSADELQGYERLELGEEFYYFTRYGTPLAFVRPLDLIGRAGLETLDGARVVDFGFGSVGQLRLMAAGGADAHGVDVDKLLGALYSTRRDVGRVARAKAAGTGADGTVAVHIGQWPADSALVDAVGTGYTVFISKNTLKNGYIHPAEEVDPRMLVHLGVDDETFVRAVHRALAPGGYFMIYNLCPPQSEEKYIPWADGRSPFARELLESVGFQLIAYNQDDTQPAREMGERLGWGEDMDLETDLFGTYTLLRK